MTDERESVEYVAVAIRNYLRDLRSEAGLSLRQIADKLGIGHTTVRYLESHRYVQLPWDTLDRVAALHGLTLRELMDRAVEAQHNRERKL